MTAAARQFDAGCTGKEKHVSRAAAEAVAALSRAPLHAYRCKFGDHWHLAGAGAVRVEGNDNGRGIRFERMRHHLRRGPRRPRPVRLAQGTAPEFQPAGCFGGPGYPSEVDAIRAARDSGAAVGTRLRGYLCACGLWHLTERRGRR